MPTQYPLSSAAQTFINSLAFIRRDESASNADEEYGIGTWTGQSEIKHGSTRKTTLQQLDHRLPQLIDSLICRLPKRVNFAGELQATARLWKQPMLLSVAPTDIIWGSPTAQMTSGACHRTSADSAPVFMPGVSFYLSNIAYAWVNAADKSVGLNGMLVPAYQEGELLVCVGSELQIDMVLTADWLAQHSPNAYGVIKTACDMDVPYTTILEYLTNKAPGMDPHALPATVEFN